MDIIILIVLQCSIGAVHMMRLKYPRLIMRTAQRQTPLVPSSRAAQQISLWIPTYPATSSALSATTVSLARRLLSTSESGILLHL
ncbi:hypothetical protein CRYUN_Cryun03dG0071300 [Craigia yunnanensis]